MRGGEGCENQWNSGQTWMIPPDQAVSSTGTFRSSDQGRRGPKLDRLFPNALLTRAPLQVDAADLIQEQMRSTQSSPPRRMAIRSMWTSVGVIEIKRRLPNRAGVGMLWHIPRWTVRRPTIRPHPVTHQRDGGDHPPEGEVQKAGSGLKSPIFCADN